MASTKNKCQGYVIVAFVIFLFIVSVCLYLPKFVRVVISFFFFFFFFSFHFILCLFYFQLSGFLVHFTLCLLFAQCIQKKKKWISSAHNPKVLDSGFLPHKVQKKKFVIEIKCIGFKKPSLATIGVIHIKQLLHYPRWT